jgi:hypothetical protein
MCDCGRLCIEVKLVVVSDREGTNSMAISIPSKPNVQKPYETMTADDLLGTGSDFEPRKQSALNSKKEEKVRRIVGSETVVRPMV